MAGTAAGDRYVVISADCHAGASMDTYREYLDPAFLDEYDAWRAAFVVPFEDLMDPQAEEYKRNYDSKVRQHDLKADGIVGEVIFPNTIPPFFSTLAFLEGDPENAEALRRSWAGLHAHNRWLVDFCNELPGRRAGVAQVWLDDMDEALDEIRRVKEAGVFGGILLPIPAPGGQMPPLHAPYYEPLWALCEDLDVPVNAHGGGGIPDEGEYPASGAMIFTSGGWYAWRPLTQLIVSGVFERHPRLKLAVTETGNAWVPQTLRNLDWLCERTRAVPNSIEAKFAGDAIKELSLTPSEYWARNCWHGASFMGQVDCELRYEEGVDKMMWGSDYPHHEGTFPYTREALRWTFQGVDPTEVQQIVGGNAATMYGFDLDALAPVAAEIGPTVEELAGPMDASEIPPDAWCEALAVDRRPVGRFF
jgi:predicted TIM-barrel fold metal-dependent hydrolase